MGIIVAHDYPRAGSSRAPIRIDGDPPLFLAGDWVGEEGMLSDASAASARAAALAALACLEA